MNIENIEEGDRIKFILKNNFIYTLKIKKILENEIIGIDKFGEEIQISKDIISVINPLSGLDVKR